MEGVLILSALFSMVVAVPPHSRPIEHPIRTLPQVPNNSRTMVQFLPKPVVVVPENATLESPTTTLQSATTTVETVTTTTPDRIPVMLCMDVSQNATTEGAPKSSNYDRIMRPARAIAAAYQTSRQRIHDWMEEPRSTSYLMPALIGGCSAALVIASFYTVRGAVRGCQSRRRKSQIAKMTDQLADGKKLIECKPDESDNDLI